MINKEKVKSNRKSWDEYFMDLAALVSKRATCDRAKVGCVLVKDKRIVATGYNGSIKGEPHCDEVGHLIVEGGCKRTIHAEINALIQCAKSGHSCEGTTAYVTHRPCPSCTKTLNQAGIKKVIYQKEYPHRYENNFEEGMEMYHAK